MVEKIIEKMCKNCVYWEKDAVTEGEKDLGVCKLSISIYSTYEYIKNPWCDRTNEDNLPTISKTVLGAYDDYFSDNFGVVVTGPKFGCNQWKHRRERWIK